MKVIGKTRTGWDAEYICTVKHCELEKFLGLYYNKLKEIEVGEVVDLGKGYDHAAAAIEERRKSIMGDAA